MPDSVFIIINTILLVIFLIFVHFKFKKFETSTTKLNDIIESEFDQTEMSEEDLKEQQEQQLQALQPLIDRIVAEIKLVFSNKAKTAGATFGRMEKAVDRDIFLDSLDTHPQGPLIKLALDSGFIGKKTINRIMNNPEYLDIVLMKFGPQLAQLQESLMGGLGITQNQQQVIPKSNNSGYTGDI